MRRKRLDRQLVGAGRAAEAEIDAAGEQRASVPNCSAMTSGAWLGSMMPPAPTRMRLRAGGDVGDDDRGRGAGDAGHVVVLGHPEAAIAPALGVGGEIAGVVERAARIGLFGDADEIEDGQRCHWGVLSQGAMQM